MSETTRKQKGGIAIVFLYNVTAHRITKALRGFDLTTEAMRGVTKKPPARMAGYNFLHVSTSLSNDFRFVKWLITIAQP